ncbi:hypothetical protein LC612_37520 [Nostoc sp. CHAB 5834]|nr:hypothetical protein [Nostoc sp. CHAB 5834]
MKSKTHQQGASLVLVLLLLTVMLLGTLSMARITDASLNLAGNASYKVAALQASEVGVSEAFSEISALASEEVDTGNWYFATTRNVDSAGLPANVEWDKSKEVSVGQYTVRYVVERMCSGTLPVTDYTKQCFLKKSPEVGSSKAGSEVLESPSVRQYKVTVSIAGPKETQTFVQELISR